MADRGKGRPFKNEAFTKELERFFEECHDHPIGLTIVHTDEDLVEMLNERLPEKDRISLRSFRRYKAGEIDDDEGLEAFVSSYKKALLLQRENLFVRLQSDVPGGWQRYAWILERKFDEWNLREKVVDETPDAKRLVFRVK